MADKRSRRTRATVVTLVVAIGIALLSACTPNTGVGGIITANGSGRSGILVELFPTGTTNRVAATTTLNDGSYELDYVTPGDYDVRLAGVAWFNGTPTAGPVATPVTVTLDTVSPVNADVAIGTALIAGVATTTGGQWAVGVTVDAVEQATGLTIASTTTDEQGDYAIGGLPSGTYVIRFTSANTGPRWYVNANAARDATPVVLVAGDTRRDIDVQLSAERTLAGTVTDHRNPVPGAVVVAITLTGSFAGSATTGPDGTFSVADLNPTSYRLWIYPPAPLRPAAWGTYNDIDPSHGVVIDLTAGDVDAGAGSVTACDPATYHHGVDLSFKHLDGADLTGCDLSGSLMDTTDLNGASLVGADLRGASLGNIEMQGTDLTGAAVAGLFACAVWGEPISPAGWQKVGSCLVGPGANLTQAPLDQFDLSGLDLTGANLTEAGLQFSNLTGANLTRVNLQGIDLSLTTITGVISSGITGTPYRLPDGWALIGGVLVGP